MANKVYVSQRELMEIWVGQLDTVKAMWADGAFQGPFWYRETFMGARWLVIVSNGLENPAAKPVALWIGPVIDMKSGTPVIVFFDNKYYFYVFGSNYQFSYEKMIRLNLATLIRVGLE